MIDTLALATGIPIPVPELQVIIYQPSCREISYIGEKNFFIGLQCLCINKYTFTLDTSVLEETTNFQIFMTVMNEKEAADKKKAVLDVCNLIFPKNQVMITPRSFIIILENGNTVTIDENNFSYLQDALSSIFCLNSSKSDQAVFNPQSDKARAIAEKLNKARRKVAEIKGENNQSVLARYISILTVGVSSMSPQDVVNLTLYQLYDLVERYQMYVSWDVDLRARLAGAKIEEKTKNWMDNIEH